MQYEYKALPVDLELLQDTRALTAKLNELGKQGWDLVQIHSQQGLGSSPYNLVGITLKATMILKRQVGKGAAA